MALAFVAEPELVEDLRAFLAHGLILDPYLAGLMGEHFEEDVRQSLASEAAQLAVRHWREPLVTRTLGEIPAPTRLGRTAAEEVLLSTAAALAHERQGKIHVTRDLAEETVARVQGFIAERGFGALVPIYIAVTFAENHGAVRHYGRMKERDFASGILHRPWVQYPLDDELLTGLLQGTYRLEVQGGERWVRHTEAGERRYQQVRQILEASGYLERRLQLIYLSQFNLFADWDTNAAKMVPTAREDRRAFTAFADLAPGMRVLECGCGMATQTFEGGLWEAVGPRGSIVGLDPAPGMLERARQKAQRHHARNVTFVGGQAEHMPMFKDGTFDVVVGYLFLHFTDAARAVREMRRVTRTGGDIAVYAACHAAFDQPWFQEWFAPIFDLARRHGAVVRQHLHEPGEVGQRFAEAGLQDVRVFPYTVPWIAIDAETTVYTLIQGVSFFQRELELLPWAARQEVIDQLIRNGEGVCERTSLEQRTISWPGECVKGTVPPA